MMNKENIINIVNIASSKKTLKLKFAENKIVRISLGEVKIDDPNNKDLIIEYGGDKLEVGQNLWARFRGDDDFKAILPAGTYELDNGKTIVLVKDGILDSISNTLTPAETFKKSLRNFSLK